MESGECCLFVPYGCNIDFLDGELQDHLVKNMIYHFNLMQAKIKELEDIIRKQQELLKARESKIFRREDELKITDELKIELIDDITLDNVFAYLLNEKKQCRVDSKLFNVTFGHNVNWYRHHLKNAKIKQEDVRDLIIQIKGFWKAAKDCGKESKNMFIMKGIQVLFEKIEQHEVFAFHQSTMSECKHNRLKIAGSPISDLFWATDETYVNESEPFEPFFLVEYKQPRSLNVFEEENKVLELTWEKTLKDIKRQKAKRTKQTSKLKTDFNKLCKYGINTSNLADEKVADYLKCHNNSTLDWHCYNMDALRTYYDGDSKHFKRAELIKALQKTKPRPLMDSSLADLVIQIASYLIWSGTRIGILLAYPQIVCFEIGEKRDNKYDIKVYKNIKHDDFEDSVLELLSIAQYAKELKKNPKCLREEKIFSCKKRTRTEFESENKENEKTQVKKIDQIEQHDQHEQSESEKSEHENPKKKKYNEKF
ncbi:hypothetical protein RFI_26496 [Reticulomyxa filosa]|uniref:Uncharacterized protein n=1 Tax=Reticulomyxa filosa TaxID=46433 RepID=X6MB73_RETFI|nr:hypothetical protein RFI_26496 [Reticulomyxa filosa]|eukprot:ETO10881.1 hypothetical protein RFI_26496 [Reticulomyxa filosa]